MTTLDVLLLTVGAVAMVIGFWKGVIVQVGAVGAVIAGIVLSRLAGDPLARVFAGDAGEVCLANVVLAKVLLFIAGYLAVRLLALLLKKTTHALSLGLFDRVGGSLFCLFEWMMGISVALNLWMVIKPGTSCSDLSSIAGGKVAQGIADLAPAVLGWAFG